MSKSYKKKVCNATEGMSIKSNNIIIQNICITNCEIILTFLRSTAIVYTVNTPIN